MTIETATYINQLNALFPEGGADRSSADDHLRLIKSTVLATFPAITGPVTASHSELNLLTGSTETIGPKLATFSLSISAINTAVAARVATDAGAGAVGIMALLRNNSAGTITAGSTVSGSNLAYALFLAAGTLTATTVATGTWRCLAGAVPATNHGWFQRIA